MSAEPDYVVIRPAPGLPPGVLPDGYDGRWYDRSQISAAAPRPDVIAAHSRFTAKPTGRFEVREDGVVAEVYEVQP